MQGDRAFWAGSGEEIRPGVKTLLRKAVSVKACVLYRVATNNF